MARRFGREQLEAMLASDLDEGARVLWVYLATCQRRGLGRERLRERLDLVDFDGSLEVLEDEGFVKNVGGKWFPLPFMEPKQDDDSDGEPTPVRVVAEEMLVEYNAGRREAGLELPIKPTERQLAKLEELAEWLNESGVEFSDFLAFAVKRTDWMRKRADDPVAYPPLTILTGSWLRDDFLSLPKKDKAPAHAGKTYEDAPDAVRMQLTTAGFKQARRMTAEELRYVWGYAENMVADEGFPEPGGKWRDEIRFLVRRLRTGGDRAGRS